MLALLGALVAGILTTLAPCVLPMLPVIVGGSVAGVGGAGSKSTAARDERSGATDRSLGTQAAASRTAVDTLAHAERRAALRRALVIIGSLGVSIIVFTLLLKASTTLIGVPPEVWQWVSGALLISLGLVALFPSAWDAVSARLGLQARSTKRLAKARTRPGVTGEVLTGVALGPVFSSCSPLYAYVIVTVLPADLLYGLTLLLAYVIGLCGTLLVIAVVGQRLLRNAAWIADPHSPIRRGLGVIFIAVGLLIAFGLDRDIQTWLIANSPITPWELDSGFIPD